jgi:hypothetical protein
MKTNNSNKYKNSMLKMAFIFVGLIMINFVFADGGGAHPGTDPGISVPVDGGLLMALLAGGGLATMFLKRKKKDE